jgi:phage tail sheath protein FI
MAFLHGVEVIEVSGGARPVSVVTSAVIALVSIAPQGDTQKLILVQNEQQASQFGIAHPDNHMRKALSRIFAQGSATVMCVNVFDDASHVVEIEEEPHEVLGGRFKLDKLFVGNLVITTTGGSPTTLTSGTDYTYNATTQEVTILTSGTYPDGTDLLCTYDAVTSDLTDITDAEVIGTVSGSTLTGLKLLGKAYATFGFVPRIIISPYFSTRAAVAAEMLAQAEAIKAHAIIDAIEGATVAGVLAGRGSTAGAVKNFYTSSKRAILAYLWVEATQPYTGETDMEPYSPFLAGAMAVKDNTRGFWYSVDNTELRGVLGLEQVLTFNPSDTNTETNLINGAGVTTIAAWYGSGYLVWGGRSAAFPTNTEIDNFVCVRRTADIIHDSLILASLQFIGLPINTALRDEIRETGNTFMRTLLQRGAIVDGEVTYDPADNPPTSIAAGQLTFRLRFVPPPPLERLTFQSFIDISLLDAINVA